MLSNSQEKHLLRIPHSLLLCRCSINIYLVGVFGIDLLVRHLLEHVAGAVGDLLVLIAAESVSGFLLEKIEACGR